MESNFNTGASGSAPVWELPEALDRLVRGGDAALVAEIMHDFGADATARITRLRAAIVRGDAPAVRIEAHSIKGSAAQMGAIQLASACQALELDARAGSLERAAPQLGTIQALFDEVNGAIMRHPLYGQ